jgi:hypothetical protein
MLKEVLRGVLGNLYVAQGFELDENDDHCITLWHQNNVVCRWVITRDSPTIHTIRAACNDHITKYHPELEEV